MNAIYFSNGAYGIEAASQYYFSKPTGELTKAECLPCRNP
ncbi:transglycosylase domain-containing protein [Peribacillus frigoritolerans]|nr:transglycosylase domain-containing protein [Peribacillus frigoritolerans]